MRFMVREKFALLGGDLFVDRLHSGEDNNRG
jgi:hypothetical protein